MAIVEEEKREAERRRADTRKVLGRVSEKVIVFFVILLTAFGFWKLTQQVAERSLNNAQGFTLGVLAVCWVGAVVCFFSSFTRHDD